MSVRERMRISELSRRSGVPVATIKYYRREGLLPEGRALNPTTVEYDEEHIQRLRLIRSLIQRVDPLTCTAETDLFSFLETDRFPTGARA